MKAHSARTKSDNFKEPSTYEGIVSLIKKHSFLGYNNCSIVLNKEPKKIRMRLTKLGYSTYIDGYSGNKYILHVEW